MADVSTKLLGQFVDCLENKLLAEMPGEAAPAAAPAAGEGHGPLDIASEGAAAARDIEQAAEDAAAGAARTGVRIIDSPDAQPVDLLDAAGAPVAKRALPVVAGLTFLWLLSVFFRRRRRRRRAG
jgi:hypothetical protein